MFETYSTKTKILGGDLYWYYQQFSRRHLAMDWNRGGLSQGSRIFIQYEFLESN